MHTARLSSRGPAPVLWLLALALAIPSTRALGSPPRILEARPALSSVFERSSGWIGGDGAYTVRIGPDTTLWLFGDTLIGSIRSGRRDDAVQIHNSAAIQTGKRLVASSIRFVHGHDRAGKPADLFTPPDGRGFLWPFAAFTGSEGLHVILSQIEETPPSSAPFGFRFRQVASWLATIREPAVVGSPALWRPSYVRLPFDRLDGGASVHWGSAATTDGAHVYVYGLARTEGPLPQSQVVVARVPRDRVAHLGAWRFFDGAGWRINSRLARPICRSVPFEFSVSRVDAWKTWVMVHTGDWMSPTVQLRFAQHPWGKWSVPSTVYRCPEAGWHHSVVTYAAKAHPELARDEGEILITYVANTTDARRLMDDPRLYFPRFVRVRLGGPR